MSKSYFVWVIVVLVLALGVIFFSQSNSNTGGQKLIEVEQVNTIDSLPEYTIDQKLQMELAEHFAMRDFCQDILKKMEISHEVNKGLNSMLNQSIDDKNVLIGLNKYKNVKYYKEDYQRIYASLEVDFYKKYPFLK